jgi:hypothetical protein
MMWSPVALSTVVGNWQGALKGVFALQSGRSPVLGRSPEFTECTVFPERSMNPAVSEL